MPTRSKKDATEQEKIKKVATKKAVVKTAEAKKSSGKKSAQKATVNSKKTVKTTSSKKSISTTVSSATPKKSDTSRKKTTKKVTKKDSTPKRKSATNKATTAKKSSTARKSTSKAAVKQISEYFDLPENYNKTTVKVLFQTPKKLFVYWEISEIDRNNLLNEHGKDFFEHSTPFLIIHNITKSYSFEIQINDYANSWYFNVPDSNCEYQVELIRKYNNISIPIKTSNELEVPNNHILFEEHRKEIFFKNVKTSYVSSKNIVSLHFINHIGIAQPVTINAFYNKFYNEQDLYYPNNPSSGL